MRGILPSATNTSIGDDYTDIAESSVEMKTLHVHLHSRLFHNIHSRRVLSRFSQDFTNAANASRIKPKKNTSTNYQPVLDSMPHGK